MKLFLTSLSLHSNYLLSSSRNIGKKETPHLGKSQREYLILKKHYCWKKPNPYSYLPKPLETHLNSKKEFKNYTSIKIKKHTKNPDI